VFVELGIDFFSPTDHSLSCLLPAQSLNSQNGSEPVDAESAAIVAEAAAEQQLLTEEREANEREEGQAAAQFLETGAVEVLFSTEAQKQLKQGSMERSGTFGEVAGEQQGAEAKGDAKADGKGQGSATADEGRAINAAKRQQLAQRTESAPAGSPVLSSSRSSCSAVGS
jgi:hypothetical protein